VRRAQRFGFTKCLIGLVLGLAAAPGFAAPSTAWPPLSPPIPTKMIGSNDAALVIAIEDYMAAQDLPGAVSNGRDWALWLRQSRGVPVVKVLENNEATKEQILNDAKGLAGQVKKGGRLWVVFIGHGAPAADSDGGVLVGVDAQQNALSLDSRSVRLTDLEQAFASGAHNEVVLVQDACFSGKASSGDLAPGLAPLKAVSVRLGPKWTVLAAGKGDQYAGPLNDGRRPAFSYLVLGALRGWGDHDKDGKVSAAEAVEYASSAIFQTVSGRKQQPELIGPDLVLGASGREAPPDLTLLGGAGAKPTEHAVVPVIGPGAATVMVGGEAVDFVALVREAEAKEKVAREAEAARLAAEEAKRLLAEKLVLARRERLAEAKSELLGDAARDFAAIESLVRAPIPDGRAALEAYIRRYGSAKVQVDDLSEKIEIAEVRAVQAALDKLARPPRAPNPQRRAVISYTSAGLFGVGGAALLTQGMIQRASVEADVAAGALSYDEGVTAATSINRTLALGYAGLGVGVGVALGARFVWATPTADGGLIGLGLRW
jgi:hypothetical protein